MWLTSQRLTRFRMVCLGLFILLIISLFIGALHVPENTLSKNHSSTGVVFISTQGQKDIFWGSTGGLLAVDRTSNSIIWRHDSYSRYYDVDVLSRSTILFVAINKSGTYAIQYNWVNDNVVMSFRVPCDTHDVDKIEGDKYVIADKCKTPESHGFYIYDKGENTTVYNWTFADHYNRSSGDAYQKDWTHMNDIDSFHNGTQFLVSPRNFDRIMLINRSDSSVAWVLGKEDELSILNRQHQPILLREDPATVLVADSRNDRVVEYQRSRRGWNRTWSYNGVVWPRGILRLSNENTIIVASGGDRVIEVTPEKEIIWSYQVSQQAGLRNPYDIAKLNTSDEMPTMDGIEDDSNWRVNPIIREYRHGYQIMTFAAPAFIGWLEYNLLLVLFSSVGVWAVIELGFQSKKYWTSWLN